MFEIIVSRQCILCSQVWEGSHPTKTLLEVDMFFFYWSRFETLSAGKM